MKTSALDVASPNAIARFRQTEALCVNVVGGRPLTQVRVASTFVARFVGLLNRSSLGADEGLLFAPGSSIHTLWMGFAIDVIFLDERWKILRVAAHVRPWRFVRAPRRTRFVLELAAGAADRVALKPGATLQWCRQRPTLVRTCSQVQ